MSIQKLIIQNFKGIKNRQEFEIRPLTIFCGPNSSGKSSCIHALAALAQTTKLSASQMPIVLDDEYAHVHLGRFLDVLHSKQIKDSFSIGVKLGGAQSLSVVNGPRSPSTDELQVEFAFSARAATQEVYIKSAEMSLGADNYKFERKTVSGTEFKVYSGGKLQSFAAISSGRFGIQVDLNPKGRSEQFDHDEISAFLMTQQAGNLLTKALQRTYYLGPFRQGPLRKYPTRGSQPTEVGAAGESAITLLGNEFTRSKTKHPNLAQVSTWMHKLGLGSKLTVMPVAKTDLLDVSVTLKDGAQLALPDLGFGISQVLPVLVQCAFAPKNSTLLFEQPELHLHDGAARHLASVFIDVIKHKSAQIIAETHSRQLFYEVVREVRAGRIPANDVILYDVSRQDGASSFNPISFTKDANGNYDIDHHWGQGLES